ncbi:hypothetical protein ACN6KS_21245 [Paenibacillus nitricinens]|uniref:hypothetical protein n=1 Tax=Paenibacillus nitricinens TaxID=3367691 RepID=UPI003F86A9C3
MSFPHMAESTGLGTATVNRQIEKLEAKEIIEIVERNRQGKGKMKLPNKYRLNLDCVSNEKTKTFVTDDYKSFSECIRYFFCEDQLKKILPRRQYQSLVG